LILPFFVFLSFSAFDLVHLLYGDKWIDTGWVLSILFLSVPAYVCLGLSTPVLWTAGRRHHEFQLQLPVLVTGAVGFYYAIDHGIKAFAMVATLLILARMIVVCASVFQLLGLRLSDALWHLMRGLTFSALAAFTAWLGTQSVGHWNSSLLRLSVSGASALLMAAAVLYFRPHWLGNEVTTMILRFVPDLSRRFAYGKAGGKV
jgi:hypothetical protein